MPVLPISDGNGNLDPLAPLWILTISAYPDDETKRMEFFAVAAAQSLVEYPETVKEDSRASVALTLLPALLRAPPLDEVARRAGKHAGNAWIAGELLLFMLCAQIHHPDLGVSLSMAVHTLRAVLHDEPTWGGTKPRVAPRTVWKAWGTFGPVAHFHAVSQMWLQNRDKDSGHGLDILADWQMDNVLDHLALAETIRRAGVERRILDAEKSWRVPDDIDLPPVKLAVPPLPQSALDCLASYRSEHAGEPDPEDFQG